MIVPRKTAKYVKPPAPPPPARLSRGLPSDQEWRIVASDSSGSVLAAAGYETHTSWGYSQIYVSRDAARTWAKAIQAGGFSSWSSVSVSGNGRLFLASMVDNYLYTSSNGQNWTARATSYGKVHWAATAASYDGMRLAAAAGLVSTGIFTSSDGVREIDNNSFSGRALLCTQLLCQAQVLGQGAARLQSASKHPHFPPACWPTAPHAGSDMDPAG